MKKLRILTEDGVEWYADDLTEDRQIEIFSAWQKDPEIYVTDCGKRLSMELVEVN